MIKDDDVNGAERFGGPAGQAFDERLVVEIPGDVHVVGLGAVQLLPAAGEQQSRAFAAETGIYCFADSAAGSAYHGRRLVKSQFGHSIV
ncbi:hypothetical protein NtRootA1_05210 [Arthrobacter sp. NtRootA1]|nr:hypothetical protein NtRootA1_05210 [Arthrobacter sp. NtRootA1]